MNHYIILIGVAENSNLGDQAESDRRARFYAIVDLIFSLGPAWQGSQSAVLLNTDLNCEQIIQRVSSLVGHADFVGVMEINARSITTIGWNVDQEGLDALYPNIVRWGVSPTGGLYLEE